MRSQTEGDPVAVRKGGAFLERLCETAIVEVIDVAHKSAANDGAHARLAHRPSRLMDVHMHVVEAGGARANHLGLAEKRSPIGVLGHQPVLDGLDGSKEPVGE